MGKPKKRQKTEDVVKSRITVLLNCTLLALICTLGFTIRVIGQVEKVFPKEGLILYRGVDPWYHARLADVAQQNFPHILQWDMFAKFPDGASVGYLPALTWLSVLTRQVGGEALVAFIPPVLAVLVIILTYFLSKELFNNKGVGLLAALFVAILPGEFFHRSLLGFVDHHVLETILATTCIYFLTKAYKTEKTLWSILSGIAIGVYILTWAGAPLFVGLVLLWFWFEFLRRYAKKEEQFFNVKLFSIVGLVAFPATMLPSNPIPKAAVLTLIVAPIVMWLLTRVIKSREMLLFALTAVTPLAIVFITMSFRYELVQLSSVLWGGDTYIGEAQPITISTLLATFGLAAILLPGGLWYAKKDRYTALFWIWAVVMLLANIGQRRWGYYTIVPISILASFFCFYSLKWFRQEAHKAIIVVIIGFAIAISLTNIVRLANLPNNISPDWYNTCKWLEQETPEPFSTEGAYYQTDLKERPKYGVLAWWDYGHWIIRIGKRVPLSSPTQFNTKPAEFFTSQSFEEAEKVLEDLNVKYIIIDKDLIEGKWYAVNLRIGTNRNIQDCIIWRLWTEEKDSPYKLVYKCSTIKVFERKVGL